MKHSEDSIRRSFVFHNKFYKNANKILSKAQLSFANKSSHIKKTILCKNPTDERKRFEYTNSRPKEIKNDFCDRPSREERKRWQINKVDNAVFIGVHVR